MTKNEFQRKYHDYQTHNGNDAKAEAAKVNAIGIDGDEAVPVDFKDLGWCLMLKSAAELVKPLIE